MARFFGDERRIAVGFIGLSYFLPDETLVNLVQRLHAWCAPGSIMAISYGVPHEDATQGEATEGITRILKTIGLDLRIRTTERLAELIAPWRIVETQPLDTLLDMESMFPEQDKTAVGLSISGAMVER